MNELDRAVNQIQQGGLVGMPTETVYGLAASINNSEAINKIFKLKGRPSFDPLIVHVTNWEMAKSIFDSPSDVLKLLASEFWPGPLTLVAPKSNLVSDTITAGKSTLAVRSPKHDVAQALIQKVNQPLAAPSANQFGHTSPTTAVHVREEFSFDKLQNILNEKELLVLDGGSCEVGIESSIFEIVSASDKEVTLKELRPGQITKTKIKTFLAGRGWNCHWSAKVDQDKMNPGAMGNHYQPKNKVVLSQKLADFENNRDALLKEWNSQLNENYKKVAELKLEKDPFEVARNLYSSLRELSVEPQLIVCFVEDSFLDDENWSAVLNRLKRASSLNLVEDL